MKFQLLVDFGLMVLIWIVQLIIYPSFKHYQKQNLVSWHHIYSSRITVIVLPLMAVQFMMSLYALYFNFSWVSSLIMLLVLILWSTTFLQAVPLHYKITSGHFVGNTITKLIRVNWLRTVLWTLVFGINFVNMLIL